MFSIPVMRALSAYNIAYAALPTTNAYMYFTPTGDAAKQKQFTLHIPLGLIASGAQTVFAAGDGAGTNFVAVQLNASNQLDFMIMSGGVYVGRRTTTRKLQDYAAFNMITLTMDTPNATALDRMRVYFDLIRETDFATTTNPAQNLATSVFNGAYQHHFLKLDYAANYGDVYLGGNTCLIGQVLGPESFLDLDLVTGNVKAKSLTSLAPEYLFMFESAGTMGANSGSAGDATVSGTLNQVTSTPTNVFSALSYLNPSADLATLANGNRVSTYSATALYAHVSDFVFDETMDIYIEANLVVDGGLAFIGIAEANWNADTYIGDNAAAVVNYAYRSDNGNKQGTPGGAPGVAYGASYTAGDIIGLHWASGTLTMYKNGVSQGTLVSGLTGRWVFACTGYSSTTQWSVNFGNPAYTVATGNADGNGYGDFEYAPPSGALALCTNNLPAQAGNVAGHFKTVLYTGDGVTIGSGGNAITGVGFQPDFVWIKQRNGTNQHMLHDAIRGGAKALGTDNLAAELTNVEYMNSFDADGFTVGSNVAVNGSSNPYVAWCASLPNTKTSGWTGSSTITPTKEIYNADLGMSIITYTGNGTAGATIPHSLGKKPGMIIVKMTSAGTHGWLVQHKALGATYYGWLNDAGAFALDPTSWNDTEPTSELISLGTYAGCNGSGTEYVAYVFAETDFIKIGSYVGNGSADGPVVNTGISPVWMLHKNATTGGGLGWMLFDNKRKPYNHQSETELSPNLSAAEPSSGGGGEYDFTSSGAKQRTTRATYNSASDTYIYLMIGQPNGPTENTAR